MQTAGLRIGRIKGVPVILTWSWLLVAAILTAAFTPQIANLVGLGRGLSLAVSFVVMLFASVFCHELAHGLVGGRLGVTVREYALTFFGGHTAFSSPITTPGDSALIAAAGPVTNLILAVVCQVLYRSTDTGLAGALLYSAVYSNLFLGLFNLLPALPLDGGALLEALIWKLSGRRDTGSLAAGWLGVLAGVVLCLWSMVQRGSGLTQSIWPVIVGLMVAQGGWATVSRVRQTRRAEAFSLAGLLLPAVSVAHTSTLVQVTPALQAGHGVIVTEYGTPIGYVDPAAAGVGLTPDAAPPLDLPVDAVMVTFPRGLGVQADLTGTALLAHLTAAAQVSAVIPVVASGRLVGLVRALDVPSSL